ncbi:MAG: TauD/TfdA family dioxygenase [Rhodospirillaceae bacterium]|jgi:taurine dioxygenase|nr:TauD/TfdA family dioxygenase [Rhodospirillaceae bacterium]MBT4489991.1 TauD/TfdA family dioxygenase [Rhodospirillaceae bacterium]MBT5191359.1 TauD/TfdA family dioxygenase [Rhodospirillaceae bacterium]MBT5898178.1 TauD/TfdA family dioxygenase [Rhodospirillaceae bacterium]MBT7759402.1 TauD/TfdA family dioxygenase [Rhodospirillaceae bacterium]
MEIKPIDGPFGCVVHGLDVGAGVDAETCRELHQALYDNRVLVIKDQVCDEAPYLAFGRQWGAPIPHVIDTSRMAGFPEMMEVGNTSPRAKDELKRNSAAFWHTDQSYDADPATSTMLYARKIPDVGGETRVIDMKAAYDDLDAGTKQRIEGMNAMHLYGATAGRDGEAPTAQLNENQAAEVPATPHALVRAHTVTGERALYGVAGTAIGIEGMGKEDGEALIAELKAHCVQDKYIYEHKYEIGDIAMWDTQMTLHSAKPIDAPSGPGTERLLWRISVRGKPAVYQ